MNYIRLTLIFLLFGTVAHAQSGVMNASRDTIYFQIENGFIVSCKKDKAEGFGFKTTFSSKPYLYKIWYLNAETPMAEYEEYNTKYSNGNKSVSAVIPVKHGRYEEWYISGERRVLAHYSVDKLDGDFLVFYKNGIIKRSEKWKNGEWVSGECYDENGKKTDYCSYQEGASFVGGLPELYRYIGKSLKYPSAAQKAGIQGLVSVHFIVTPEGLIKDVTVVRSVHRDLDAEAVRIVREMPKWKPGRFEGQLVENEFTLPINFKLE